MAFLGVDYKSLAPPGSCLYDLGTSDKFLSSRKLCHIRRRHLRIGTNVPAASGLHAIGAFLRTPVTQQETREAIGNFDRHNDSDNSTRTHQVRHFFPGILFIIFDSILDLPNRSR